ncbi:MAG: hypothetical protein ACRDL5_04940 [Solirubrobacteraceae bacterium]
MRYGALRSALVCARERVAVRSRRDVYTVLCAVAVLLAVAGSASAAAPVPGKVYEGGTLGGWLVNLTVAPSGRSLQSFEFGAPLRCNDRQVQQEAQIGRFDLGPGSWGDRAEPAVQIRRVGAFRYQYKHRTYVSVDTGVKTVKLWGTEDLTLSGDFRPDHVQAYGTMRGRFIGRYFHCDSGVVRWSAH